MPRPSIVVLPLALVAVVAAGCGSAGPRPAAQRDAAITSADLGDSHEPIELIIQRKTPGLLVTLAPDGSLLLNIRNARSWEGDPKPPLYIVNGAPYAVGPGGALSGLNPYDIDTIKVLKGAEAGLYGIEGANGVIVITTKQAGPPPTKKPD